MVFGEVVCVLEIYVVYVGDGGYVECVDGGVGVGVVVLEIVVECVFVLGDGEFVVGLCEVIEVDVDVVGGGEVFVVECLEGEMVFGRR